MRCLKTYLEVEVFDVWGIDFMGPFPSSLGTSTFLWLLTMFGVPRVLISDGGSHFINKLLEGLLRKNGVKHKVATPYHHLRQVAKLRSLTERSNPFWRRLWGSRGKDWSNKLDDALWAYRTAYKTPLGTTPFNLVYGKACHLPVELEYKALWAVKLLNFDIKSAKEKRLFQLHELDEIRMDAFEIQGSTKKRPKLSMTRTF
ncbi:uncharacterized protein LOC130494929 [Raphanus sativus]|uniref:Uncharacterized protein LOC130494929 n=1 Tax=Raphanus sativus TaxID=3726 RepID=A0A9W3BR99_RAPSA|nr:uncharacterized protein LOC130494929 [Raphanus sativus]